MAYNNQLRLTKKSPRKSLLKKQTRSKCHSLIKKGSDVKTSIFEPLSFVDEAKKIEHGKTSMKKKDSSRDSREYQMRLQSTILLRDPFYFRILFSLFLDPDLEEIKVFLYHLQDDINLLLKTPDEYGRFFGSFITQVTLHFESLIQGNEKPEALDNFLFCPSFSLFEEDANHDSEPEPPSFITSLINTNSHKSIENDQLLMKKLSLGTNPSKPDGKYFIWDGPRETFISWFTSLYFVNDLIVPLKKHKTHTTNDGPKDEIRPFLAIFINNHVVFMKPCDPATIYRNCETIFDYFLNLRDTDRCKFTVSPKNELMRLSKKIPPDAFACGEKIKKMNEKRYKNILSGISYI